MPAPDERGRRVDAFGPDDRKEEVLGSSLKTRVQAALFDHMGENIRLRVAVVDQTSQELMGEEEKRFPLLPCFFIPPRAFLLKLTENIKQLELLAFLVEMEEGGPG